MARNKVMKLWTTIVTAFLALFTALGLITTTATAAVPQTETTRNSDSSAPAPAPVLSPWSWSHARALPPTMKQRIHAEAHGKSPRCRHRPLEDATADTTATTCSDNSTAPADPVTEHTAPLQR